MNILLRTFIYVLIFAGLTESRTFWQTTHQWLTRGECSLVSNNIKVITYPYYVEVEEEAEIKTLGSVTRGDPETLEIVGEFTLPEGSAIRSMLLWWDNQILKAKLKDRVAADSAYEDVVDRDAQVFRRRDPALIEYAGNNRYTYKIYPVSINHIRKIRIRYIVPMQNLNDGLNFEIKTAFTAGSNSYPENIPVKIVKGESISDRKWKKYEDMNYNLEYGSVNKELFFGSTYMIPSSHLVVARRNSATRSLFIKPMIDTWEYAVNTRVTQEGIESYYTGIFVTIPGMLSRYLEYADYNNYTFEVRLQSGESSFISDVPNQGKVAIYFKTQNPWDQKLHWTVYGEQGQVIAKYTQFMPILYEQESKSSLPILWAAQYSFVQKTGDLGYLYGFVDSEMSLLALEEDALSGDEAEIWRNEGVPLLLPAEIIPNPNKNPDAPFESVIFDASTFTIPSAMALDRLSINHIEITNDGLLILNLQGLLSHWIQIELYDVNGKLIHRWNNIDTRNNRIELKLPYGLRGNFIMKLHSGKELIQKRILLP